MKKLKFLLILLIIITTFLLIYSILSPNIIINQRKINLGDEFNPDIEIYNLFEDLTDNAIITENVDTKKVGIYEIKCQIKYLFFRINRSIVVEVIDKEKPVITLEGNNPSLVCPNGIYKEEGYTAIDNYDKNITDKVSTTKMDNNIFYSVKDSSGNETIVKREIKFVKSEAKRS